MKKVWIAALCLSAALLCSGAAYAVESPPRIAKDGVVYEIRDDMAMVVDFDQQAERITLYGQIEGVKVNNYAYMDVFGQWNPRPPAAAREVVFAEGVTIASGIGGWPSLERILWPSTLTEIDSFAFCNCPSLREVNIPEGVTRVGSLSFRNCAVLSRVTLPSTVQEVDYTFGGCGALAAFEIAPENSIFEAIDGVVYRKADRMLMLYPAGKPGEEYVFPSGALSIAPCAFTQDTGSTYAVKRLKLPEGWTKLGGSFPNSLEELWIPASLTQMEIVVLPCDSLRHVYVAPGNPAYRDVDGAAVVTADGKTLVWSRCIGAGFVPEGVESVPVGVFQDSAVETISIPRSVARIDDSAFSECTSLRAVSLPITLSSIGDYAFEYCIALESIALPPGLKSIGRSAFFNCTLLHSVTIPDSVTTINGNPFGRNAEDFTVYAAKGSAGFWAAWLEDLQWAEPGGVPLRAREAFRRETQAAVVNNKHAEDILNLRAGPTTKAKILGSYRNGATMEVLDVEGTWAHVLLGDQEGYMSTQSLLFTDALTHEKEILFGRRAGREQGAPFELYTLPAFDAPRDLITEDVSLSVVESIGVWYQVVCQGRMGYVQAQAIELGGISPDNENVSGWYVVVNPNPGDRLHLRAKPSTGSKSLGQYFNGTQVKILDNDWDAEFLHVRVDGQEGYMMRQFLRKIEFGPDSSVLWGNG